MCPQVSFTRVCLFQCQSWQEYSTSLNKTLLLTLISYNATNSVHSLFSQHIVKTRIMRCGRRSLTRCLATLSYSPKTISNKPDTMGILILSLSRILQVLVFCLCVNYTVSLRMIMLKFCNRVKQEALELFKFTDLYTIFKKKWNKFIKVSDKYLLRLSIVVDIGSCINIKK